MKSFEKIIISILLAIVATSCSFLDINPKGEVFDNDMFTSARGYEDAIYGIYAELGKQQDLYAGNLMWLPEVMTANTIAPSGALQYMPEGDYFRMECNNLRKDIWGKTYKVINHINNILDHIKKGGDDEFQYTSLYKGECMAIRAFLHYEMLTYFGAPIWASEADKAKAIPYVTEYSFDITPFSSLKETYDKIIAELKEAETLLAEDETLLPAERDNNSRGGFISNRIIHMNRYAVQAMLARVYWSMNDLENAAIYAQKVIDSNKFQFRPTERFVQPDNGTLDMSETIFGIYSKKTQEFNARQYGLIPDAQFTPFSLSDDYIRLYQEGTTSGTDLRLNAWFDTSINRMKKTANPLFYSHLDKDEQVHYNNKSILGINIIRIPEMYYIMAEALLEKDVNKATEYMDAVLKTRGVDMLKDHGAVVTKDFIFNERRKEFYGEGLLWKDMKRQGMDIVVSSTTTRPGNEVSTYKIPYPTKEDENRQ